MFCYNCGAKIYNGMATCPKCKVSMEPIVDIVFMETIDTLEPYCIQIDSSMKKEFQVGKKIITFSGKNYLSGILNHFMTIIYDNSWKELLNWIECRSFDDIIRFGDEVVNQLSMIVSYAALVFMKQLGSEISVELLEKDFARIFDMRSFWSTAYLQAEMFQDLKAELDSERKNMHTPMRGRWVGGGFGIGGAVKGMINAELLNAGGKVAHSVGDTARSQMRKLADNYQIKATKNELKQSPEFIADIEEKWIKRMSELYHYLKKVVQEKGNRLDGEYCFEWNAKKEFHYIKLNQQETYKLFGQNLYDMNMYVNLYAYNRRLGKPLYEMASFLGFGDVLLKNFAIYADKKIIQNMDINELGFGMPEEELRERKSKVKELEDNNFIYHSKTQLSIVLKEQEYSRKLYKLCEEAGV